MKRGFTFVELLVGLLVSMFLLTAMAVFLGNASYTFQGHKATMQDRANLQRAMSGIARELAFLGSTADDNGQIDDEGEAAWFIDMTISGDAATGTSLTYYLLDTDIDAMATVGAADDWTYTPTTYTLTDKTNPLTGETVKMLTRDGDAYMAGIVEFSIAFGVDSNGDGNIAEDEWVTTQPADDATKNAVYGGVQKLKLTLGQSTTTAEGETYESRLVREVLLRNRG